MTAAAERPVVVIPCFNEELRLDADALVSLAGSVDVLLVDDGSTDHTLARLWDLSEQAPAVQVLPLRQNQGKAEAVRCGLIHALEGGAPVVGYLDADFSTPPEEFLRLVRLLASHPELDVVLGSRVALLGTHIERRARRHYLGRVFGTLAASSLRMAVYDTQCGAKAFRAGPELRDALEEPFLSRWVFDVELLGRLRAGSGTTPPLPVDAFRELPLESWHDVPGGTLGAGQMAHAIGDLARIAWRSERARRRHRQAQAT